MILIPPFFYFSFSDPFYVVVELPKKTLPIVQETQVRSLDWGDPLEKEMTVHSRILAWEIPWTEEPGGLQSMRSQKSKTQLSD